MDARNEGIIATRATLVRVALLWRIIEAAARLLERLERAGRAGQADPPPPAQGGPAEDPPGADPYAAPGLREVHAPIPHEWDARWLNADGSLSLVSASEADAIRREFAVGEVERPCFVCGAESDRERGWVRARPGARIFWLCNACVDRVPACRWDGDDLVKVTFVGEGSPSAGGAS